MPTVKGWKDVRILSFDLQTVEFAYYQDYAISITSVEGNYRLSFSRCSLPGSKLPEGSTPHGSSMDIDAPSLPSSQSQSQSQSQTAQPLHSQTPSQSQSSRGQTARPDDSTRRNAHEDSAHFAQELLKDERLGPSVFEMIGFLRSTVGIVEALDAIESGADFSGTAGVNGTPEKDKSKARNGRFDVLVKAAGWWRIQYSAAQLFTVSGGSRHALDVRFINGRVMVVDGSVDLHAGKSGAKSRGPGLLAPIPKVEELVKAVLDLEKAQGPDADGIVPVNYGDAIICGSGSAPRIIRRLHDKILDSL